MRTSTRLFLSVMVVLLFAASTFAQEALWNELNNNARSLYQQGKYSEAAKAAEEALKVAEKTFGPSDPHVAASLNNWLCSISPREVCRGGAPIQTVPGHGEKALGQSTPMWQTLSIA